MRSRCKGPGPWDSPVSMFCHRMRSENSNSEPLGHSRSPRQKGPGDSHLQKRGRITKEVQKRPGEIYQGSELSPEEPQGKDVPRKRLISSSKHNPECFSYRPYSFTRAEKIISCHCPHTISHFQSFFIRTRQGSGKMSLREHRSFTP